MVATYVIAYLVIGLLVSVLFVERSEADDSSDEVVLCVLAWPLVLVLVGACLLLVGAMALVERVRR